MTIMFAGCCCQLYIFGENGTSAFYFMGFIPLLYLLYYSATVAMLSTVPCLLAAGVFYLLQTYSTGAILNRPMELFKTVSLPSEDACD